MMYVVDSSDSIELLQNFIESINGLRCWDFAPFMFDSIRVHFGNRNEYHTIVRKKPEIIYLGDVSLFSYDSDFNLLMNNEIILSSNDDEWDKKIISINFPEDIIVETIVVYEDLRLSLNLSHGFVLDILPLINQVDVDTLYPSLPYWVIYSEKHMIEAGPDKIWSCRLEDDAKNL